LLTLVVVDIYLFLIFLKLNCENNPQIVNYQNDKLG
jgi:hypothetical protein